MSEDSTIKSEDFIIDYQNDDTEDDQVILDEILLIEKTIERVEDLYDDIEKTVLEVEREIEKSEHEMQEMQKEIAEIEMYYKDIIGFNDVTVR